MEWLMVWVRSAGCGQHTTAAPRPFLERLAAAGRNEVDTEVPARITGPVLGGQLDALNGELTEAVFGSLPDPLLARWVDGDPIVRLAALCAIYLWILYAVDALTLPRGNVEVWRYHLLSTGEDAREALAAAV